VHISEGMCRQCAWEKIKLKCKICGEIISKGYPRLLAHTTAHYTSSELLYNEKADENIILINFESSKISNDTFSKNGHDYALRCKICGDRFIFKKEHTIFSKWIDHIKSHYIDKDLVKKEWIAKDIIHLNYDSVIQVSISDPHVRNDVSSSSSITYRELTKREGDAYRDALYRIRSENSITKSKGR
jgi:transcription elongation factor Elf1